MATYRITTPGGNVLRVQADSEDEAFREAQRWRSQNQGRERARQRAQTRAAEVPRGLRSFAQGATFGLADEFVGGMNALEAGIRNATGRGDGSSMRENYTASAAAEREAQARFARERPGVDFALQATGGMTSGFAGAGRATVANGARGALSAARAGALGGAAYGFGTAEGGALERVPGAAGGAAAGAVLGPVARSATSAAGRVLAPVGRRLQGLAPAPSATRPERRVAGVVRRATERDQADVAAVAARRAEPELPFEGAGENLVTLAEVAAQTPGPTRQIATEALTRRSAQAGDRVQRELGEAFGADGDFFANVETRTATRARQAAPLYERAYAESLHPSDVVNRIDPLLSRLPTGALDRAADLARIAGEDAMEIGFRRVPGGGYQTVASPRLRLLHWVKQALDADLSQYRNPVTGRLELGGNPQAQAIAGIRQELGQAMNDLSPAYAAGNRIYAGASGEIDALRLGRSALGASAEMTAPRLSRVVAGLSEAEQELFRQGLGEALIAQARSSRGGVGAMRNLLRSQEMADRVRIAFPDDQSFARFMGVAEREALMATRTGQVLSGSPTARREAAARDLSADPAGETMSTIMDAATLNVPALTGRALRETVRRLPRRDRSVLGDAETNGQLGRALFMEGELARVLQRVDAEAAYRGRVGALSDYSARVLATPLTALPTR